MQPEWILFFKKRKENKKGKNILSLLFEDRRRLWSQGRLHVKVTLIHYVVSLPFPPVVVSVEYKHVHSMVFFKYIACCLCDNSFTEFPKQEMNK